MCANGFMRCHFCTCMYFHDCALKVLSFQADFREKKEYFKEDGLTLSCSQRKTFTCLNKTPTTAATLNSEGLTAAPSSSRLSNSNKRSEECLSGWEYAGRRDLF